MNNLITKIVSAFMALLMALTMFFVPSANVPEIDVDTNQFKTNYDYVFVHGLGGWGQYDLPNYFVPYWGMFGGNLMTYLNTKGFKCHAASVSPTASSWDRACELYAQLTGSVVDYGKEHSERCNHARFGADYTNRPLVDDFSAENKINLLGHSFGGATVLYFISLMNDGSAEEKSITPEDDLSPLFKGGKGDWINSVVTLSAPLCGTSCYIVRDEINADPNATLEEKIVVKVLTEGTAAPKDGRIPEDSAEYDMYIDNAIELCKKFKSLDNIYYFSIPCEITTQQEDKTWTPNEKEIEILFRAASKRMGKYTGSTPNGFVVDESWQQNDGLVNTISARAPYGEKQVDFDENNIQQGVWNVMPVHHGDHMSLQGELLKTRNVRELYVNLLSMINGI